jgi:acyl carrier protein
METRRRIIEAIKRITELDVINEQNHFYNATVYDDMEFYDVIMEIEEEFGVSEINDEDKTELDFEIVKDFIDWIEPKIKK